MLTEAQREMLRRLANGQAVLGVAAALGVNIYATASGNLKLTDNDVIALEDGGLVEYDELDPWTLSYVITDAGRAALGEEATDAE
jgi:hypothetical protein